MIEALADSGGGAPQVGPRRQHSEQQDEEEMIPYLIVSKMPCQITFATAYLAAQFREPLLFALPRRRLRKLALVKPAASRMIGRLNVVT
jgi:hypothetical protein